MSVFEQIMQLMIDAGAFYVFIWLLLAGLIYGMLTKYEIFGDSSANAGIALGGSFFLLLGIYAFAPAGLFLNFGAALGFSLTAMIGLIIVLSMAGVEVTEMGDDGPGGPVFGIAITLFLISILGALAYNLDWGNLLGNVENTFQDVIFPILFLIFILIIVLVSMSGDD